MPDGSLTRSKTAAAGRRLAAATVSCCALSLAFIPAATAKREHEASASSAGSTQTTAASAAGSGALASTESAPGHPARRHGGQGRTRQAPTSANASTSAASGTPGQAVTTRGGHAGARAGHGKRARSAAGEPAASAQQGARGGEAEAEAQLLARSTTKARGHKGSGKGHNKAGTGKRSKDKPTRERQTGGPGPVLTTEAPASASATAATASATSTPAASASPGRTVATAGVSTAVRVVHRARRAYPRQPTRARSTHPAARAAQLAAVATPLAVGARHVRRARRGTQGGHGGGGGAVTPLVRSITKIVQVVPVSIRVLIAGLLALALALAVRSCVAAVRARRLERQRSELLADVGLLQAALLPATPARIGPVDTSAAYRPAAGPGAGGDFYDVFALADGRLAVIVGDISGHGRQALPHTALVRFTLRAYLEAGLSPRDALQTAGAVLERQLGGEFATVVVAVYHPQERVLVYACAGHPPPLILGAGCEAWALAPVTACTSPPIGVGMRTGTRQSTVALPGRAQVCFYTDGVTEARIGSELYGAKRLEDTLRELGEPASASVLLDAVAEQADARPDDMAACLLSMAGGQDAPRVLVEEVELDRPQASSPRAASFLRACGVGREEAAEALRAASAAAGRAGAIVLEVRHGERAPEVVLRRERLTRLHTHRAGQDTQAGGAKAAR